MLLESAQTLDEDMAMEILDKLVDGEKLNGDRYELQLADGRAGYGDMVAMSSTSHGVLRMNEHHFGTSSILGLAGVNSTTHSTTQRYYDDSILLEACRAQYYGHMQNGFTARHSAIDADAEQTRDAHTHLCTSTTDEYNLTSTLLAM
ncbi:hypothetical protein TSTA_004120 [Talaromyces stipitatus ATCC 10500]|uniref:Uncharacterized protein n=1 Tax=Talaromyces stipitatus (strain ATCC 10500 / CBS 375.48 / QM 6759 / NRRL 1006) TaxID=441959 RepID=B8MTB1_TALSN|nr:uncharacterized protein TSTA_004120 [Talaromyces stipitatus ATCC 10500]EED12361.1 hypothetical protein TSTA_004120 [Talaromyces stipitatus ATCC 10500]